MDHIDGPVQGTRAELMGPQFSPGTVVFDEEKIAASLMGLSIKSCGGVAGETDVPVRRFSYRNTQCFKPRFIRTSNGLLWPCINEPE